VKEMSNRPFLYT